MDTGTDLDLALDVALQRHALTLLPRAREPARAVFEDLTNSARLLREAGAAPLPDPQLFASPSELTATAERR